MVVEKDITFYSTVSNTICCHCLGKVHIGYIPDGKVVGLSKLARTVEVFARRLQLQEQLTGQIADALMEHMQAKGAIVYDRGGAYVHDYARNQEDQGSQTSDAGKTWSYSRQARHWKNGFFRMFGEGER